MSLIGHNGPPSDLGLGDPVRKLKGYPFPGWIIAVFNTRAGNLRFVVEHATEIGMLHIYSPAQLELRQCE